MLLNDTRHKSRHTNSDIAVFDFLTCQYGEDKATMYAWCFKYKGEYTIGRTYYDYSKFISRFTRGTECYYLAYTADIRASVGVKNVVFFGHIVDVERCRKLLFLVVRHRKTLKKSYVDNSKSHR